MRDGDEAVVVAGNRRLELFDRLSQILLDLCANASDAMPGGGKAEITTGRGLMPDGSPAIVLSVAGPGAGIPTDALPRALASPSSPPSPPTAARGSASQRWPRSPRGQAAR